MSIHLKANNLERSFRIGKTTIPVLRGISLEIFGGEAVFLCGASGAGKTTLLYTLAGLETPESGTVEFEGQSLYDMGTDRLAQLRNRRMGFVFQSYFLLPELTALENVLVPAMIRGMASSEKGGELLRRVGLSERLHHLPAELSGGEQQRVAIARALINGPAILFADEPTGNLDSHTGEAIIGLLLDLARSENRTLVVVTHDEHLARRGDRLLRIEDGCLAATN
ncbi:MAG: ABC transporter ATP-binding protein [Terrimicrobiaceae bacterium]